MPRGGPPPIPRVGRRGVAVAAAVGLVVTVATAGCSDGRAPARAGASSPPSAAASSVAPGEFVPRPARWDDCGNGLRCATVEVPLDDADPTGATVRLALAEAPARHPGERIGALLVNPGGPGGSGIDLVKGGLAFAGSVLDRFDVIGFDPRGVGQSQALACGDTTVPPFRRADPTPDDADEEQRLEAAARAVADDCRDHAGPLLDHMGTDDVVRDMDTIRVAIGETTISYAGFSYGTLLGLRYAERFPGHVRAMVLDGVVDPTQGLETFLREQAAGFERALGDVFAQCPDGRGGCPEGGAAAAYDELAAQVERQPLPAGAGHTLGPGELPLAAAYTAYSSRFPPTLFAALRQAQQGDGTALRKMAEAYEREPYPPYAAVECVDSPHPSGARDYATFSAELRAASPRFGGSVANELLPCAFWPAAVHDIVGPVHAAGVPPILVVGTTGDAVTPYAQAEHVAAALEHAVLLTYEGTGHASYGMSRCTRDRIGAYLVDGALPEPGTTCTE